VDESAKALGIMAIKGPRNEFAVAFKESLVDTDPFEVSAELANDLKRECPGITAIYYLPAWNLIIPVNRVLEGFASVFGPGIPVFGGAPVGGLKTWTSHQFFDGRLLENGALAIGFADPGLEFHIAISHGHEAFSSQIEVTRSDGPRIYEINNKPAVSIYTENFNIPESAGESEFLTAFAIAPFGLELPEEKWEEYGNKHLIYLGFGKGDDGSIYFPLELEKGTKLCLAKRDDENILKSVDHMARQLQAKLQGRKPLAVFDIECASRGSYSFNKDQLNEIISLTQSLVCGEESVPWLGWHALGEFGPLGKTNMYHHKTAVLCAITRKNGQ
jgi:hypothetical protein